MGGFFISFGGGVGGRVGSEDDHVTGALRLIPRFPIQLTESENDNPLMLTLGAELSSYVAVKPDEVSVDPRFVISFGDVKHFEILASAGYSYGIFPISNPLGNGFSVGATIEFTPFYYNADSNLFLKSFRFAVGYDARMYASEDYDVWHFVWGGVCLRFGEVNLGSVSATPYTEVDVHGVTQDGRVIRSHTVTPLNQ